MQLLSLQPSPNNVKVRIALGYLGIPYEEVPQRPNDRSAMMAATNQPLTPVLVHDGIGVFDSAAILRHLHAATPESTLFPQDPDNMRKLERWEMGARYGLKDSLGQSYAMIFGRVEANDENIKAAQQTLLRDTAPLEKALAKRPCLMGDTPNAADITWAGALTYHVGLNAPALRNTPFFDFMSTHFTLSEEERPLVRAWASRLLQFDAWIGG
ncbi:MAG: glutathione S-transferase family protein [Planctomycetes bacterium]|nr:glutathione S-transferase family protein [Planctomycetota bacterium]